MKLIHCADLHLDSPLEANLTGAKVKERAREVRDTFLRMARYAAENGVGAILIAGDLFDSERIRESTKKFFLDTVAAFPSISFFYLAGNHDRIADLGEGLPENLFLFGDAWSTYDLGEVTVTGGAGANEETLTLDPQRCNIVMLHGQLLRGAGRRDPDVIRAGLLRGKGIDYLALGHIHSYGQTPLDPRGVAVYSGCPEGRGFDECGECGFVLLRTEGRRVTHRFVPFARRRLYAVQVDLSGIEGHLALEERVLSEVAGIDGDSLVKVTLTGTRTEARLIDTASLTALLSERFYFATVRDESRVCIRAEDYTHDASLRGAFVRRVLASELSEEMRERVIACGLRALSGEEP